MTGITMTIGNGKGYAGLCAGRPAPECIGILAGFMCLYMGCTGRLQPNAQPRPVSAAHKNSSGDGMIFLEKIGIGCDHLRRGIKGYIGNVFPGCHSPAPPA